MQNTQTNFTGDDIQVATNQMLNTYNFSMLTNTALITIRPPSVIGKIKPEVTKRASFVGGYGTKINYDELSTDDIPDTIWRLQKQTTQSISFPYQLKGSVSVINQAAFVLTPMSNPNSPEEWSCEVRYRFVDRNGRDISSWKTVDSPVCEVGYMDISSYLYIRIYNNVPAGYRIARYATIFDEDGIPLASQDPSYDVSYIIMLDLTDESSSNLLIHLYLDPGKLELEPGS